MISNTLILYLQKHWKYPDSTVDLPIFYLAGYVLETHSDLPEHLPRVL